MELKNLPVDKSLSAYVKNILVFENDTLDKKTTLPFFADGYPGIIFQKSTNGVFLRPKNKYLTEFFMYGQTIVPIELSIDGPFTLITFQLYPFAAKTLIGIDAKHLNDDCFDLNLLAAVNVGQTISQLRSTTDFASQNEIISSFLQTLIQHSAIRPDQRVQQAISMILSSKGKILLKTIRENLRVTERTLERQFSVQVGVSPKQFIKIVQFNASLNQLSEEDFVKLSDISFENNYADQSHFIRMFKKFTGKTPSEFQRSALLS